eukprot:279756_1
MDNKERLELLNNSYQDLVSHSNTIGQCCQQTDDILSRLQQIKQKLVKGEVDVADDFKDLHESHIQNTQYIEKLELYENESIRLKHTIDRICGKPLSDPVWYQSLNKRYLNKAILYELYRQGRFKAAQLFAEETKLKEVEQDREKFIKMHSILRAIDHFDIDPALKWIAENEEKKDANDDKDINFASPYVLSKYSDILLFLLHRDKFLHISATGTKQEMHGYMRSELEKLRNSKYKNPYSQEIINNLHFEASSIAYYVDDWKLLYYLKMFPHKRLSEIPVQLTSESLEKYIAVIEPNENKKNETNHNTSPRKKRKISSASYNVCYLCPNRDFLTEKEKLSIYESFEFPELIDSVWTLARKCFINAFINIELDLPHISGLQSCVELSWTVFPKFNALSDDISGDFDDTLTLFKDFNKERQMQSNRNVPFVSNALMDEDIAVPNANGAIAARPLFKWEDYDTLNEDEEDDDDDAKEEVTHNKNKNKKQQKGRFRIENDETSNDYGDYNDPQDDITGLNEAEQMGIDGYIGYMNRKEWKLEMKKKRIIRRSKNKEYKDRMDKYGTAEFLYHQIQAFVDTSNKKKRSKSKLLTRPTTIMLNQSRRHRYDSRVQRHRSHRFHSQSASPIAAASIQSAVHRIRSNTAANTTPPPPSDSTSDAAEVEDAFMVQNNDDYAQIISHTRRSHQRRLYQNLVRQSIQHEFSPTSNVAPLLLENENDELDLIFASRSSSPLSSQLTGMTLDDEQECNDDMAAQALLLLKSKSQEMQEKETVTRNIDWENESDSSEDEERYWTQKDKDVMKNEEERLKISSKMGRDFAMADGYLAHSIFVCPIQTDYVADPQAKLGCGHLISYNAFVRLQNMQRQRQHQENRNRNLKIHCPNCDQQSDVDKDIRYVYLGRFPNLRTDPRFADILDKKDLDQNATKWIPGATQINGQE